MDLVAGDEVVLAGAGFVADEEAAGVVVALVVANGGVVGAHQVDAFAAVVALVGLKGGDAGAGAAGDVEGQIVAVDVVVGQSDVGAVDDEDAFEVGVADVEAGNDDVGDACVGRCRYSVDEDAIAETRDVNDGVGAGDGNQREGLGNRDLFL